MPLQRPTSSIVARYIHNNPAALGIKPRTYLYSNFSALTQGHLTSWMAEGDLLNYLIIVASCTPSSRKLNHF